MEEWCVCHVLPFLTEIKVSKGSSDQTKSFLLSVMEHVMVSRGFHVSGSSLFSTVIMPFCEPDKVAIISL